MANLQFQEDLLRTRRPVKIKSTLPEKLMAWGIVKNHKQATVLLTVLSGLAILITLYNVYSLTSTPTDLPAGPDPASLIR
jgi:hypothetical protein